MNPLPRFLLTCLGAIALLSAAAPAPAAAQKMTFEVQTSGGAMRGSHWIAANGEITAGTAGELEVFLKQNRRSEGSTEILSVLFNSTGGDLAGAMRLGETLRRYRLGSDVGIGKRLEESVIASEIGPGECVGACVVAYMGGLHRSVERGSRIGLHGLFGVVSDPAAKPIAGLDVTAQKLVTVLLSDYASRMGVDPMVVTVAAAVSGQFTHYMNEDELKKWRMTEWHENMEPWSIEPRSAGVVASSTRRDKSATATIFCRSADKRPRLLLRWESADMEQLKAVMEDVTTVQFFGKELPKSAVSLRNVQGKPALEYVLEGLDGKMLIAAKSTYLSVDGPSFPGLPEFGVVLSKVNAEPAIRVALKNCI